MIKHDNAECKEATRCIYVVRSNIEFHFEAVHLFALCVQMHTFQKKV